MAAIEVKDPTGCGDAYRAGLLLALAKGVPLMQGAQLGSVLGSIKIAVQGCQNHKPTLAEIRASYESALRRLAVLKPVPVALDTWLIYLLAAVGLSLSPGPNGLLALTHGALHGHGKAMYTISAGPWVSSSSLRCRCSASARCSRVRCSG